MNKRYLSRIIAKDSQGLKLISACCFRSTLRVSELRYLKKNQIFLSFLQRYTSETNKEKINSVCKFEFVESVKSKNIDQNNKDLILELFAIDLCMLQSSIEWVQKLKFLVIKPLLRAI